MTRHVRWRTAGAALLLASCGGPRAAPPPVVATEGPEQAILRLANRWEARYVDKGLRSPPSPVGAFERHVVSRIELTPHEATATEVLTFSERFTLRDGTTVQCGGSVDLNVGVTYGRKAGEPAVELAWAALSHERPCEPPGAPVPPFERAEGRARFVLRSDQLVGVEPALERRTFLPLD